MNETMTVELVGGPNDGELVDIAGHSYPLQLERLPDRPVVCVMPGQRIQVGIYLHRGGGLYDWMGYHKPS